MTNLTAQKTELSTVCEEIEITTIENHFIDFRGKTMANIELKPEGHYCWFTYGYSAFPELPEAEGRSITVEEAVEAIQQIIHKAFYS